MVSIRVIKYNRCGCFRVGYHHENHPDGGYYVERQGPSKYSSNGWISIIKPSVCKNYLEFYIINDEYCQYLLIIHDFPMIFPSDMKSIHHFHPFSHEFSHRTHPPLVNDRAFQHNARLHPAGKEVPRSSENMADGWPCMAMAIWLVTACKWDYHGLMMVNHGQSWLIYIYRITGWWWLEPWNLEWLSIDWEQTDPNWLIFFRGLGIRYTTNQLLVIVANGIIHSISLIRVWYWIFFDHGILFPDSR